VVDLREGTKTVKKKETKKGSPTEDSTKKGKEQTIFAQKLQEKKEIWAAKNRKSGSKKKGTDQSKKGHEKYEKLKRKQPLSSSRNDKIKTLDLKKDGEAKDYAREALGNSRGRKRSSQTTRKDTKGGNRFAHEYEVTGENLTNRNPPSRGGRERLSRGEGNTGITLPNTKIERRIKLRQKRSYQTGLGTPSPKKRTNCNRRRGRR